MEKETLTSQLETIGEQILMVSRNELYLKMRFMDVALSGYAFVMNVGLETIRHGWAGDLLSSSVFGRTVSGRQGFGESNLSPYGASWDFSTYVKETGERR